MFFKLEAALLNDLTDVAQVPVSMLGKIFKINLEPIKSAKVFLDRSSATSVKFDAFDPIAGKVPEVCISSSFRYIVAILLFFDYFQK